MHVKEESRSSPLVLKAAMSSLITLERYLL